MMEPPAKRTGLTDWESRRFGNGACLQCGAPLTGITGPKDRQPEKGSIMVCAYCQYVMEWDGAGFAELSAEVMKELEDEPELPELQRALAATRAFQIARRRKPQEEGPLVIGTNDPAAAIDYIKGINPDIKVVVLEQLPPEVCEECSKLDELRPYGLRKESGVRKWVCKDCAEKNPAEMEKAFWERVEGTNPV